MVMMTGTKCPLCQPCIPNFLGTFCTYPHFIDEETEAQRGEISWPRQHSSQGQSGSQPPLVVWSPPSQHTLTRDSTSGSPSLFLI